MTASSAQADPQWVRRVDSWDDLASAIADAQRLGHIGWAHLARALNEGRIAFLPLLPDISAARFKQFARGTANRPAVTLIGDDDHVHRGPAGWSQAGRAIRWARSVLLHAAGAEPSHYIAAVEAAQVVQRLLIIECDTATLPAWISLVRRAPHRPAALVIVPRDGAPHPRPLRAEEMQ